MPKLIHKLPQARLHSPSGRARVRINNKTYWLGPYGSESAQAEYDRLISAYLANGRQLLPDTVRERDDIPPVTITTLIDRFSQWAIRHYVSPSGAQTREAENFEHVTKLLGEKYGTLPVDSFGPSKLIALREEWIRKNLARHTINAMCRRVRQVFKWGISREIVPAEVYQRLQTVEPLTAFRGGRETSGSRGSVHPHLVEKTLPFLPPLIRAFVVVLYRTGARVSEVAKLTTGMIDRSGELWSADLSQHKTAHKGKRRVIYFGPWAQEALTPFLLDDPDAPIFSPQRVDARQEKRLSGKRPPGKKYSRYSLGQVLRRAIRRGGLEPWTLAQLRHTAAVKITDSCGIETAQQVLGHSKTAMTRHYAQDSSKAAMQAAKKIG